MIADAADSANEAASNDIVTDTTNDLGGSDVSDTPPVDVPDVVSVDSIDAPVASDGGDSESADGSDAVTSIDAMDGASADAPDVVVTYDANDAFGAEWMPLGSGTCNARQRAVPEQPASHVDYDASITWLTNPPSSGPHYMQWAHWGTWPDIPPGYWVHNLEHSGVVFLHSCVEGTPACDATVAALSAAVDTIPTDPVCMPSEASPTRVRVVVTHYEPLDTPIAGAAWGWLYAADCVDPESMSLFYTMHSGTTLENFCGDGTYP